MSELVKALPEMGNVWETLIFSNQSPKVVMAPIYDNGSSLGRELNEERVKQLLQDERQLRKYVEKGISSNRKIARIIK
jgi:hypothetical protein